jgi:hypothetical protein
MHGYHGILRAAQFSTLILLLSFPALPAHSAPGAKPPADHWAGDFVGPPSLPTRIERAGGPGAFAGFGSRGRLEFATFARPALTPSGAGDDGSWSLLAGTGTFDSFDGRGA